MLFDHLNGLTAIGGLLLDQFDFRQLFQYRADTKPDDRVVVGQEDFETGLCGPLWGRFSRGVVFL